MTATGDHRRRWLPAFYAGTLLVQLVTFVLRPSATYRAIELDVPSAWLGALGASFAIVPLVLAVPAGQAVDRLGERTVLLAGAFLTGSAALAFLTLGTTVGGLATATVLLGVGHLLSVVAQQALVANRTESTRYDAAFGHYTFAASAGQAVGPGLIILFGGRASIPETGAIFGWSLGLSVLLVGCALAVPGGPLLGAPRSDRSGSVRELLRTPGMVRALVVSSIVLAAVDISLVYLPALGSERGIAAGAVGLLLTVRAASSMLSRLFLGQLAARLGRGQLLSISLGVAAAGTAVLPIPMPAWLMVVMVGVMGAGLGAGQPLTMSWLAEAAPAGQRGRAMSLRLTGNRIGQVVVPTAAGAIAVGAGAGGVLWLTAAALTGAGAASRRITGGSVRPDTPIHRS